jgi:hypothetical protein
MTGIQELKGTCRERGVILAFLSPFHMNLIQPPISHQTKAQGRLAYPLMDFDVSQTLGEERRQSGENNTDPVRPASSPTESPDVNSQKIHPKMKSAFIDICRKEFRLWQENIWKPPTMDLARRMYSIC